MINFDLLPNAKLLEFNQIFGIQAWFILFFYYILFSQ